MSGQDDDSKNDDWQKRPLKVYLFCTGVSVHRGGIETFARECFDGLHGMEGLDIQLFKGAGPPGPDEHRVWCLKRTKWPAALVGKIVRRNAYTVEQMTSMLPLVRRIRAGRPDIIFTSENNLLLRLSKYRRWFGVPYRMIFSNGAPLPPGLGHVEHVQEVAPFYYDRALAAGRPATAQSMVPYGITVPEGAPQGAAAKEAARRQLALPLDRPIVASVGWISATHKRMDYTVREIAAMPRTRPYLLMVGRMDETTGPVVKLARQLLGEENFRAVSVPYEQVGQYYQAADAFALASLTEGFGRVYLEALIAGLPCVVHDDPVMRYVLGEEGTFADLSKVGTMAEALAGILARPVEAAAPARRREMVRRRFSWPVLRPAYLEMFRACMRNSPRPF